MEKEKAAVLSVTEEEIAAIRDRILKTGEGISRDEADRLATGAELDALCDAADAVSRSFNGTVVDSCSIVNARSGMCGEDCKWCAQSRHYTTNCETYNFLDEEETMRAARLNEKEGIRRFSLVTSGRAVSKCDMEAFCKIIRRLKKETDLYICASMGLIDKEGMEMLKKAGVERYHCNMETSSKFFPKLCSTHTPEDKHKTIRAAREAGLDVCSGGIIGMGETMADRLDFAFELRDLDVDSVPVNILNPIPGTPLGNTPLISEEEVIRTVALFRLIMPRKAIRFAGGRMRLSPESMLRIMKGGMNGVLMGDMLTTVSNSIADDRRLFAEAGLEF